MGRFDREIGKELAERLRAADFNVKRAEAKLKEDVEDLKWIKADRSCLENELIEWTAARERSQMSEKMRAQETQFLRDCVDLALDERTGLCAEDV